MTLTREQMKLMRGLMQLAEAAGRFELRHSVAINVRLTDHCVVITMDMDGARCHQAVSFLELADANFHPKIYLETLLKGFDS
jgi:hypothetical protein